MEEKIYNNFLNKLYYLEDISLIRKAYKRAFILHQNQYRDSGEPYIIHPLSVASILADMHADIETLSAALLHDTIEDTNYTNEMLQEEFGSNITFLVNGVTNISKSRFNSKEEQILYNSNKFIQKSLYDARIILIKLADRLHNMRTIDIKSEKSKINNSRETLYFYVPLARDLHINYLKDKLEDISFKYLYNEIYQKLVIKRRNIIFNNDVTREYYQAKTFLKDNEIDGFINLNIKNIYSIYQELLFDKKTNIYQIDIVTDNKNIIPITNLNVITYQEYLENKYGVASNWFSNSELQSDFINSNLYVRLKDINQKYNENFDVHPNKVKILK